MTAVWQALIVLAWMLLLLLVFAYAALLREVRELQAGVRSGDLAGPGKVTAPALATSNEEGTYALAVDPSCASCRIAVGAFARSEAEREATPGSGPDRRIVTAVDEVTGWPEAASVGVVVDRALWDSLHIQTTPMLLRFDPAGVLRERKIVGSAKHLEKLLGGKS